MYFYKDKEFLIRRKEMPAKSKAQRKLFGIARGIQKGEIQPDEVSGAAAKIAKGVSSSEVDKFAKTKEAGLPQQKEEIIREYIREYIEECMNEWNKDDEEINEADRWIQQALNPSHKGYCTPMSKKTCTPKRKALARRFKKGIEGEAVNKLHNYILEEIDDLLQEGDRWIQGATNPEHKGYCTPMSKKTCTPKRKALARRFKKGI
jgi:hypothetical protein